MEQPSGVSDLLSDTEQAIDEQTRELREKLADLERMKSLARAGRQHGQVVDETGAEITPKDDEGPRELDWKYQVVEYKGEEFNVRKPQPQALQAFAMMTGKRVPEATQREGISAFVVHHMSPKSFARFMERMIDPDDPEFTPAAMGELMRMISTLGTARPIEPSRG